MNEKELRARVAHIQIIVRRLLNGSLSGDFSSAFRGGGLEFAQLRQYERGDEVRSIDWKSSAKMHKLMVKEFVQEKERTVIIVLDLSSSLQCASRADLKIDYARTIAAALAMIAQNSNDKVGLVLFSDTVNRYIQPKKGRVHGARIVKEILTAPLQKKSGTHLKSALDTLVRLRARGAILFFVSDWIEEATLEQNALLSIVGKQYESVAVRIIDPREYAMPDVGVIPVIDPESGQTVLLDTRGAQGKHLNAFLAKRLHDQKNMLQQYSMSVLDIEVGCSFIDALTTFFHGRSH